jgi:hypothetical protein
MVHSPPTWTQLVQERAWRERGWNWIRIADEGGTVKGKTHDLADHDVALRANNLDAHDRWNGVGDSSAKDGEGGEDERGLHFE